MNRVLLVLLAVGPSITPPPAAAQTSREALIARGKSLELSTPYEPVPGDATQHHAAGYATVLCSGIFISGLDSAFVAENTGYFTAPYDVRSKFQRIRIDRAARSVAVTMPNGTQRLARQLGSQGCVALPVGKTEPEFKPVVVLSALPDASTQPWPMGDKPSAAPWPTAVDRGKVDAAVEAAFDPAGMTAAFVVTYKGRIIAERYGPGVTMTTPLESWSMGKSLTGTLMGVLIQQGAYTLDQPAPIPEWQKPGDARARIRIRDI